MTNTYLIIGATGAIGYGLTKAIQEAGETATLLVRNRHIAIQKLGNLDGLTLVEGDVHDTKFLSDLAQNHAFIFHGGNASYENWATEQPAMTRSVIDAAAASNATVIFPGNVYNYGPISQPISEITPFNPTVNLGRVRVKIEQMLQLATEQRRIKTMIVRLAEIWGPNVTNKQFAPVFENALSGKAMPWLISTSTPQQLLYNLDAGRAILALSQRKNRPNYEVINVGGQLVPSIESWLEKIAIHNNAPAKISVVSKPVIQILGRFVPAMRELSSLAYKYQQTITLNDDRFYEICPQFHLTPMDQAINETLEWFQHNGAKSVVKRRQKRKQRLLAIWRLVVDNLAISLFPAAIGLAATQLPQIQNFVIYIAVAAGIYWTPGLHKLTDVLKPKSLRDA